MNHPDEPLFQIPAAFLPVCEDAVRDGLADTPEEYWKKSFAGDIYPTDGMTVLEMLVAGIIRSNKGGVGDTRSNGQRMTVALRALIGSAYLDYGGDEDDRAVLWRMASIFDEHVHSKSDLRAIARTALRQVQGELAGEASKVTRLVAKFHASEANLREVQALSDPRREFLQLTLLNELAGLLRSSGLAIDSSAFASPNSGFVNDELGGGS